MQQENYDSTEDTARHIQDVRLFISKFSAEMARRAMEHDKSKFESPEKELFDKYTPVLKTLQYGTPAYYNNLHSLQVAIDHHYKHNSHHPQHWENGINGFDLFDLIEMYCDWQAAVKRTNNGDMGKSIEINAERFDMSPQLVDIFRNTHNRTKE